MTGQGLVNNETQRVSFQANVLFGENKERLSEVADGTNSYIRSPNVSADFGTSAPWVLIRGAALQRETERRGFKGQIPGADSTITSATACPLRFATTSTAASAVFRRYAVTAP